MWLLVASDARPPYRFGDVLAVARRSWVRQMHARMREAGFDGYRQTDAWLLRLLSQQPWAIGELGGTVGVTRQAARKLADGMVERGYVQFSSDPHDARRTLVVLTRKGRKYARAVAAAQDGLNDAIRNRVSFKDLAITDSVLRAVLPTVESRRRLDENVPGPSL